MNWLHPAIDALVIHDFRVKDVSFILVGDDDPGDVLRNSSVRVSRSDASFGTCIDPVDCICSAQLSKPSVAVVEDKRLVLDWIEFMNVIDGRDDQVITGVEMRLRPARFPDARFASDHLQTFPANYSRNPSFPVLR